MCSSDLQRRALGIELDRLLGAQLARLRRRFLLHGIGISLLLPAAFALLAFALDHLLRLPQPIRLFHSCVVLGLFGYGAIRFLRYPLTKQFSPIDVAVLVERAFPELHQRLVSAIQLKGMVDAGDAAALRNQSPAMIEQLLADTAATARSLPFERLLDGRRTLRVWSAAGALLLSITLGSFLARDTALAFVLRHLGYDVSYLRAKIGRAHV